MDAQEFQKPSLGEWMHWAEVVTDHLTNCVHVYKRPPYVDVFMADSERQIKTDQTIRLLRSFHLLLDQAETPPDLSTTETIIEQLDALFVDTLDTLPALSSDMQKLLKSPWMSNFPNKIAESLFRGESDKMEGIGSGQPEHGRLPAALTSLLEREQTGDARKAQEGGASSERPSRHDAEGHARWTRQNSSYLRTAGRVE